MLTRGKAGDMKFNTTVELHIISYKPDLLTRITDDADSSLTRFARFDLTWLGIQVEDLRLDLNLEVIELGA